MQRRVHPILHDAAQNKLAIDAVSGMANENILFRRPGGVSSSSECTILPLALIYTAEPLRSQQIPGLRW
jgi:hypothetical protein